MTDAATKIRVIGEAVGWYEDNGVGFYWRREPDGQLMACDGFLTDAGAMAALRWAMGEVAAMMHGEREDERWPICAVVCNDTRLRAIIGNGGPVIERDWPEGKPLDPDTIRDVIYEAIERGT